MLSLIRWLSNLIPTNPICLRVITNGSRRWRHLVIRGGYLAILVGVMLAFLLMSLGGASMSLRSLAASGAAIFQVTAYVQILLICLLTPVFMSGAIMHEANSRTWDILLSTPLSPLQIVLGNLFGRYFFVVALLLSSLPLFLLLQMFGGVPGQTIIIGYAVAAASALLVAAIAVTLSSTRIGGKRAVLIFYVAVVLYLVGTILADQQLRTIIQTSAGDLGSHTTWLTALNPFLAIEALLSPNRYVTPPTFGAPWLERQWMGHPVATFATLSVIVSIILVMYSTLRVRNLGTSSGEQRGLSRFLFRRSSTGTERTPRGVGTNPVAWRESHLRRSLSSLIARWGFLAVGLILMVIVLGLHIANSSVSPNDLTGTRTLVAGLIIAETIIILLVAINLSATTVSREREDGSLDLILTTPIQPGSYLAGKLRGIIFHLLPMIALPVVSVLLVAITVWGWSDSEAAVTPGLGTSQPLALWSGCLAFVIMFVPFIAFCIMIGLHWSIRSRGTVGSVVAAVIIVGLVVSVIGGCGLAAGRSIPYLGASLAMLNPGTVITAMFDPQGSITATWLQRNRGGPSAINLAIIIGSVVAAGIYSGLAWGMHRSMTRTFMMTVRRLSGTT